MIIDRDTLKTLLTQVSDNDFTWPSAENPMQYLESLCHYIGDPDPVLRDELIYPILGDLVSSDEQLPDEKAAALLLELSSSNYLSYSLGSQNDDAIFKRTFSALIIANLLDRDLDNPFLTDLQRSEVGERLLHTFINEKDIRSYVPEKGWAHALAHYSDAIGCLLASDQMSEQFLLPFLKALGAKLSAVEGVWTGEEDERWTTALAKPFFTNTFMPQETALSIIASMGSALEGITGASRNDIAINNKHFLRSLYFRGLKHYPEHPLLSAIFEAQEQINRHINYV
jgi:hypothetical protein